MGLYRYIDWSITVPLQMVEFYFILAFGYCGEAGFLPALIGFILGMCGWGFILFEIFAGEAGQQSGGASGHVKSSFDTMKFIVTIGWSIYPLGYFFGYLCGGVAPCVLNLVYNLADFVNKIAFCLAIWNCAKIDTEEKVAANAAGYKNLA